MPRHKPLREPAPHAPFDELTPERQVEVMQQVTNTFNASRDMLTTLPPDLDRLFTWSSWASRQSGPELASWIKGIANLFEPATPARAALEEALMRIRKTKGHESTYDIITRFHPHLRYQPPAAEIKNQES